ncbi:MAG: type IV pilus twitching motility protein PilT [Gemmatimonadaceae bacterium]
MAQLDRFLSAMVTSRADSLVLSESDVAKLHIGGTARPITKQVLSGEQVVMLLREIAPPDAVRKLDSGEGATFRYSSGESAFLARAGQAEGRWNASIALDSGGHVPAGRGDEASTAASTAAATAAATTAATTGAQVAASGSLPASAVAPTASIGVAARIDPAARARIDRLLGMLVERGASDLHLRCGEPPILRRDGEMQRLEVGGDGGGGEDARPVNNEELEAMLLAIMPQRNQGEYAELNDTDFAYEIEDCARFRANAMRERKGAAAVFRVIPARTVTVEQLGISQEVQNLCYLTKGLVLVTGPTGSGKSTTLCSLVDLVNRMRNDHVITIEDPIEFVHPNKKCIITQRQVGVHTSSFKHALRAALREDPDIILVGELRDLETVSIAIETAETGHLVFGTLHTTTAPSTIDRIIDQFPPDRQEQIRVMLSESLKGVISQTLCRKIGGGRVAAREILLSTPAIANLIREGKTFQIPSILQTSRKMGMITLNDALIEYVDAREVEPKEAYMKSVEKTGFLTQLRQRGHDTSFIDGNESDAGSAAAGSSPARVAQPARPGAKVAARR